MPGTLTAYTIDRGLRESRFSGILISLGHVLLELLIVILLYFGVGRFLGTDISQIIIGIAGGIVLLFIGIKMIIDNIKGLVSINLSAGSENTVKKGKTVINGFIISALNPYFIFWWTVVGLGLVMKADFKYGVLGVVFFYIGHIIADMTWFGLLGYVVGKFGRFLNYKVYKEIIYFLGAAIIFFGGKFLIEGIINSVSYL